MTSLSATRRQDQRRRIRRRLIIWAFIIAIGAAGTLGYKYGQQAFVSQEESLRAEIDNLQKAQDDLIAGLAQLQQEADQAKSELTALEDAYNRDVPGDALRELVELAASRLENGVPLDRLRFVLNETSEIDECGPVEVKRFRPNTPLTSPDQANELVSFANGAVIIRGQGVSERDEQNNPLAWYDPQQPVDVTISLLDGRSVPLNDTLPIRYQTTAGSVEHRIILSPGPRSFLLATYQQCPFP